MNTLTQLKELIHTTFDIDAATLADDAPLADYGLDSLSLAELLFVVEDRFHIEFAETPRDIGSLAELAAKIDSLRTPQPA